jgi:hypothetical protein
LVQNAFATIDGVISMRVTEGLPQAVLFYGERGAVSCYWKADWARETFEYTEYFELDATFYSGRPYVLIVPTAVPRN